MQDLLGHDSVFRDLDRASTIGGRITAALAFLAALPLLSMGILPAMASAGFGAFVWVLCVWWPDRARGRPDRLLTMWRDELDGVTEGTLRLAPTAADKPHPRDPDEREALI